jgi:type IV pilus assembly protein PilW
MLKRRPAFGVQRGLTLVELLVGIAVGMFVLAGATLLLSTQLGDNRRLLLETQLQQDLRASLDIMTRELRRAGASPVAAQTVWVAGAPEPLENNYAPITVAEGGTEIVFSYYRDGERNGPWGYRLREGGIDSLMADAGWQELTDRRVMRVTRFDVALESEATELVPCPRACSADPNDTSCWPELSTRVYTLALEAESVLDPEVRRSLTSRVRVRNDQVDFNGASACPG